jgi:NDP-sugar pyrophosphorylase family protein
MDIHNPIYVCPDDLKGLHDRLLERKRVIEQRKARERARLEKMKKAERDRIAQEKYIKRMKKYFDLVISNEQINIVPLKSVQEFYQEGNTLHHCVGQMRYYEKADTLILSARIDNKPIETIEINLTDLSIVQCRGKYNKNSEYHDIILDMVKDNINKIRTIKRRKAVA